MEHLITATVEDLTTINEIGPEIASSIMEFFHEHKNIDVMKKFSKAGVTPQKKEIADNALLQGNHLSLPEQWTGWEGMKQKQLSKIWAAQSIPM